MLQQQIVYFDIEYKGIKQSELSIPGSSDWKFPKDNEYGAMIFNMVHTAIETNYKVDEFFALPSDWKAILMAYSNVKAKMQAANNKTVRKSLIGDG